MAAPTRVSSSASAFNTSTTPKTVAGISVQAGDLIVVSAGSENGNSTAADPTSTGYTFTLAGTAGAGGSECEANTWYATAPSTATISVTNTVAGGGQWGMEVTVWRNHGGVGNVFAADSNTTTSAPSGALTTTGANSAVDCVVADWNASATAPTYRNLGDTPVQDAGAVSGGAYSIYAWHNPDAGAAGAKTIGLTAPTMRWAMVAVEILAATASGITGDVAASAPSLTVGPPTASISGTVAVPVYAGAVAASTPTVTAGVPTASISGTTAVPVYSGTPTASLPALTAGPTTAAITGTTTAPSGDGTLNASLPEITVGPATLAASGTITVPTYAGDLAASTAALSVGPATAAWTGTSTPPTFTGTLGVDLPGLEVGPTTATIGGTVTAPGASTLAADLPTIVVGPPSSSIAGTISAPVYAGAVAATLPQVSIGPPAAYLLAFGTTSAPAYTGSLEASLPAITVGPMTAAISDTTVPPLPTTGVSLTVSTGTRGLTVTTEARSLEVST